MSHSTLLHIYHRNNVIFLNRDLNCCDESLTKYFVFYRWKHKQFFHHYAINFIIIISIIVMNSYWCSTAGYWPFSLGIFYFFQVNIDITSSEHQAARSGWSRTSDSDPIALTTYLWASNNENLQNISRIFSIMQYSYSTCTYNTNY